MDNYRLKEIRISFLVFGFFAGLALSLLGLVLILEILSVRFTFINIARLVSEHILLISLFFLPFLGALAGYFIGRGRSGYEAKLQEAGAREEENNSYINSVLKELTAGNLYTKFGHESVDEEIMRSLLSLQSRLKDNRELEKATRKEESRRNWTSEGLAKFGDLLRTHSSDRDKLAAVVISTLVRYLEINQGGFFIIEEVTGKKYIRMIGCHAYERDKFPDKRIDWGEGLIGAVAIEKKSYYTDKIPENYLTLTSGLGRSNPRFLLIVPLVVNDEVYGVFELASFSEIEDHKIQFIERVAENTATTLNIMESTMRTEHLLKETQDQASMLTQQEEKVRRNIEELKQTQLEAARQSEQFISFTNTVNHTLIRAEYDIGGILRYANTRFLKKLGYSGNKEVEGKHISTFIHENDHKWFDSIWNRLSSGGAHFEGFMRHVTKLGQDFWTMATFTCVRKDDGSISNILFIAIDATEQKAEKLFLEGQIRAMDKISSKAEFSPDGRILSFNELFVKSMNYSEKELESMTIFNFTHPADQERFNDVWEHAITGTPFHGQMRMYGKFESEIWYRASINAVPDMSGEVERIIFLAFEITREKAMEITIREQHSRMKEKEEDQRLLSIDAKKQMSDLENRWEKEKSRLQLENNTFREMIESYPYPAIALNNQGFITNFNRAAEHHWNLRKDKVLNTPVNQLFAEKQTSTLFKALLDPGRVIEETKFTRHTFSLADGREYRDQDVSVIKTQSGPEWIYTLIIHLAPVKR